MKVTEFATSTDTTIKTVKKWIDDGLVPNANLDENYVPDSARAPYTKARAKNTRSIYCSIVDAAKSRKHVLPQIYGICPEEFDSYIDQLVSAGLIIRRETDGVTYYDATPEADSANRKLILQIIREASQGIAEGLVG